MRAASRLSLAGRQIRDRHRSALIGELTQLDQQLLITHQHRVGLLAELEEIRDELWPRLDHHHARRPDSSGRPCVRPLAAQHQYLWGRRLRSSCLAILGRHGRLALPDLHSLLHLYGYGVASDAPVKALADAMGYEVDRGHARRVERGVYELRPDFRPRRGRLGDPDSLGPVPSPDWCAPSPDDVQDDAVSNFQVDPVIREDPQTWWPTPELRDAST